MVGIMEERKTIKMKNSVVNWHGYENYNMNCNIEDLKKRGFECSSYNNDLAPSYTNKKGNVQVFFFSQFYIHFNRSPFFHYTNHLVLYLLSWGQSF